MKKTIIGYGLLAVAVLIINAAILVGAVWLVVKVLKYTGVIAQ